jgi:hypothetical protein
VREKSPDPTLIVVQQYPEDRMKIIFELIAAAKWVLIDWREKHEASRSRSP